MELDKLAFESKTADRGYTVRADYLKEPHVSDALVTIFKDGQPVRQFRFPAYKVWNIAAHFRDIVDGEIEKSAHGYKLAAWDGVSGAEIVTPDALFALAQADDQRLLSKALSGANTER